MCTCIKAIERCHSRFVRNIENNLFLCLQSKRAYLGVNKNRALEDETRYNLCQGIQHVDISLSDLDLGGGVTDQRRRGEQNR